MAKSNDRAVDQLQKLLDLAKDTFSTERYTALEKLYEHFAERIVAAPASGKVHFHNCYPGGYLDHVHNVIVAMAHISKSMSAMGCDIDFTKEQAIFTAMNHDLGKLGTLDEPYYVPQTSDWHMNRGELYVHNPKIPYMNVADQSLYLLQHFGVTVDDKEFKSIKIHDGLYSEGNKPYFISYAYPPPPFHTNLIFALHWADHMATLFERDTLRKSE